MRDREDIENDLSGYREDDDGEYIQYDADEKEMRGLILEILLDIREIQIKRG